MRNFLIDVNILFSCLISGKEEYLTFFVDNRCFLPDFGLDEIARYQSVIRDKTRLPPGSFENFSIKIFSQITVLPNIVVSSRYYLDAFNLCRDIDPNDTVYIAFALALDFPFLTRDKLLADGLKAKGFTNVITLDEMFS